MKILSWNTNGLKNKLECPDTCTYFKSFDILCLSETWLRNHEEVNLSGYNYYHVIRPRTNNARRNSGGISIFYKNHLHIEVLKDFVTDTHIWCTLPIKTDEHILLCTVYIPPENSDYANSCVFNQLEEDMVALETIFPSCKFLITGDFNARTGLLDDFCKDSPFLPNHCDEAFEDSSADTKRFSVDQVCNNYGKLLINLNSLILNEYVFRHWITCLVQKLSNTFSF